mmetsp:Transcript_80025/g.229699  ORF Transcript_80025/g.229699 Transcript_80025/m.229699 type:complete len:201 (+) Transcript_80025:137-739(+)
MTQVAVMPAGKVTKSPARKLTAWQPDQSPLGVTVASPSKMYVISVPAKNHSKVETSFSQMFQAEMPSSFSASSLAVVTTDMSGLPPAALASSILLAASIFGPSSAPEGRTKPRACNLMAPAAIGSPAGATAGLDSNAREPAPTPAAAKGRGPPSAAARRRAEGRRSDMASRARGEAAKKLCCCCCCCCRCARRVYRTSAF